MDSGNSGSIQSSSGGGDEEYESRTESISSYLNPSTHFASISNPNPNPVLIPPPSLSHHPLPPTSFYDPSDSAPFSHSPPNPNVNPNPNRNALYNLDLVWPRNPISDPNYADFGVAVTQSLLGSQGLGQGGPFPAPASSAADANAARVPAPSDHQQMTNVVGGGVAAKNPKKRTRASRRAPTHVLTTDTTNFRQMVQEFTGIPAAPFSGSASFSRRFDLFGGGSAMGVGPLYPLRPSAQKIQLSSPYLSSPSASNAMTTATTVGTSNNYQQHPSDHVFPKQPQNLLNLQNPIFSFQSLLNQQQQQQHPLANPNATILGTKSDQGNPSINPLDHGRQLNSNLGGFQSSARRWRDGGQDEHLGAFEGTNGNSQDVRGYKLNSSDFQAEKGLENVVSSRGDQGNVDSWICPSD